MIREKKRVFYWAAPAKAPPFPFAAVILWAIIFLTQAMAQENDKIHWRFATIAPQGFGYANQIKNLVLPVVEQASGGNVTIKVFWGGSMGSDRDILRKMRFGHLNGAGLSSHGVTIVCPEMSVLQLPFLFNDYSEVDYVKARMRPRFEQYMEKSGVFMFAWIDQDFDQIYSSKYKFETLKDFKEARFLTWYGPMEEEVLKVLGSRPLPVVAPRIPTILADGLADSMIGPAIFVVGSQMFTHLKYVNPMKIRYSPALVVVRQEDWKSLPEKYKKEYYDLRTGLEAAWGREVRRDNRRFFVALKKYGIQENNMPEDQLEQVKKKTRPLWEKLEGELYPRDLLQEVLVNLEEFRSLRAPKP